MNGLKQQPSTHQTVLENFPSYPELFKSETNDSPCRDIKHKIETDEMRSIFCK